MTLRFHGSRRPVCHKDSMNHCDPTFQSNEKQKLFIKEMTPTPYSVDANHNPQRKETDSKESTLKTRLYLSSYLFQCRFLII